MNPIVPPEPGVVELTGMDAPAVLFCRARLRRFVGLTTDAAVLAAPAWHRLACRGLMTAYRDMAAVGLEAEARDTINRALRAAGWRG